MYLALLFRYLSSNPFRFACKALNRPVLGDTRPRSCTAMAGWEPVDRHVETLFDGSRSRVTRTRDIDAPPELSVGAAYQIINNIGGLTPATTAYGSTYFGITIPDSSQKVFTAGAIYKIGDAKIYGSYIYSHVYPADYRNDSFSVAASYFITPALQVALPFYIDFLHHANTSGTRITTGPTLDYFLSKRTDVYVGVDYNHLTGAWTTLAGSTGSNQPFFGYNSLFEATIGLRHRF
jgi:predicted porin